MYSYQTMVVRAKSIIVDPPADLSARIADTLAAQTAAGWEFVQAIPLQDVPYTVILIFRRGNR
jgi:hypothetical protein